MLILPLLLATGLIVHCSAGDIENVVGILSGYNQIVTSSTLKWVTASKGKAMDNAVVGARVASEDDAEEVKMWVCRASSNGMWVSGRLAAKDGNPAKCTVSMHGSVSSHSDYETLENVENGGKLNWVKWNKYSTLGTGTVTGGQDPYLTYVARRKAGTSSTGVSHNLGKLDPTRGLGKISVVEEDGVEREYEDGEVLVESEPVKYEMTDVKFNMYRAKYSRIPQTLGSATLRNNDESAEDDEINRVDTVIAYKHNLTVSWGHGHAVLTGYPVSVRLINGTTMDDFKWAIDSQSASESIYPIETTLAPQRGVNVTLIGNWTESTVPFSAKITAFYPDGSNKSRTVMSNRREVGIRDVRPVFGPVYFLANFTNVPTTTTTTTTTTTVRTTSTTLGTTTSTEEPKPIPSTPMEMSKNKKTENTVTSTKDVNSVMADAPKADEVGTKSGGLRVRAASLGVIMVLLGVICLT